MAAEAVANSLAPTVTVHFDALTAKAGLAATSSRARITNCCGMLACARRPSTVCDLPARSENGSSRLRMLRPFLLTRIGLPRMMLTRYLSGVIPVGLCTLLNRSGFSIGEGRSIRSAWMARRSGEGGCEIACFQQYKCTFWGPFRG